MKIELGKENAAAEDKIPPSTPDGSKIGINYADAYIKEIKHKFDDGGAIRCKRRGLKLTLTVKDRKGEGLMRRFEHGPEVQTILHEALKEAAKNADATFSVEDGVMCLEVD